MSTFLKRIEMQGFKSFATKEEFDFQNEAVGVVGPNGSGKSNIVDAIRWVLGERGAKNLRGDVQENLIFAGTPKKAPASLARVTMVFNNKSRELPFDNEEIAISRRIDRSGTSQFFINDKETRLTDVTTMLAKVKLGSRGLTIISQGQADVFVSASSEERRELIEEILGLKEFRLKKRSAERKLSRSQENIRILQAKINEITPHLKFLRRQKSKWEKMSEVEKELKTISDKYFSFHYTNFLNELNNIESNLSDLLKKKKEKQAKVNQLQEEVRSIPSADKDNEELEKIRKEIRSIEDNKSSLYKNLAKAEARLEVVSEKEIEESYSSSYLVGLIKSFIDDFRSSDSDKTSLEKTKKWVDKFSDLFSSSSKKDESKENNMIKNDIDNIKNDISALDNKINNLRQKEKNLTSAQSEGNVEFRKMVEKMEQQKDELRDIEKNIQDVELKKERVDFKIRELKQFWQFLEYPEEDLEKYKTGSSNRDNQDDQDWVTVKKKIERLRSEIIAAGEIDESLIKEANETEQHYNKILNDLEDLEKTSDNLEKLISDLDKRIHKDFRSAFSSINKSFNEHFRLMFAGGKARMFLEKKESVDTAEADGDIEEQDDTKKDSDVGVDISVDLPRKKIKSLEMLSGGEKSLISIAALFALISVSPPPFLVLDEIDAALDEVNSRRFADLIAKFSEKTQFIIITHNRVTMEALDALYGITMGDDGVSRVLSLKLEEAEELVGDQ